MSSWDSSSSSVKMENEPSPRKNSNEILSSKLPKKPNVTSLSSDSEDDQNIITPKSTIRSEVWQHFTKLFANGKANGAKCAYCKRSFKYQSANGTSVLIKHIKGCWKCPQNKDKKQKTLSFTSGSQDASNSLGVWSFNQEVCRDAFNRMVIIDEQPFRIVECEGFRNFCSVLQPKFKLMSCTTVARDCYGIYLSEKMKLKNLLLKPNQRICLTTDCWTSLQNLSYMCLTAHFIDSDWKLHKRIINFCIITSHKGETIAQGVENCLIEWEIEKLGTLTVNNASSNDVAIGYLKRRLYNRGDTFLLGGEFFHVRCCAHILNLVVRDGLTELKNEVIRIRRALKYVKSSPQKEQSFKTCAKKVKITSKSFFNLDVTTRWNSTYLMLEATLKFQKAFERLGDDDNNFISELCDIEEGELKGPHTTIDWDNAWYLTQILKKFYDVTVRLSGSLYVTSNMFFQEICGIQSSLIEWTKSSNPYLCSMARKMRTKFDKYWGNIEKLNILVYVAVVLDPRCKLKYVKFCLAKIHSVEKVNMLTEKIVEVLRCPFDEYESVGMVGSSLTETRIMEVDDKSSDFVSLLEFERRMEQEENDVSKSEVDRYLEEPCEKNSPNFDVLNWWKVNCVRYMVISQVARDVLAIPVSTVASESAFSTGGRVLDQFRSSLSPKFVECLICTQDWLRDPTCPLHLEETIDEIATLEPDVMK